MVTYQILKRDNPPQKKPPQNPNKQTEKNSTSRKGLWSEQSHCCVKWKHFPNILYYKVYVYMYFVVA